MYQKMIYYQAENDVLYIKICFIMDIMNKINEIIGVNISHHRQLKGLTQSQLGEICGVEYGTIQRWEKGKTWPKPDHVQILVELFNIEAHQLYQEKTSSNFTPDLPSIFNTLAKHSELIEALSKLPNSQDTDELVEDITGMINFEIKRNLDSHAHQA